MKLKTLKEINPENELDAESILLNHRLKEEAIKWIKSIPRKGGLNRRYTVNEWIEHFFNITEEDLK